MQTKNKGGGRTRANGEGSYRIRGSSVEFRWDGKSISEKINGRTTKELRERLIELRGQPAAFNPRITLSALAQEWYDSLEKRVVDGTLEESTRANYKHALAKIKKEFSEDVFVEVDAQRLYDGMLNMRKASKNYDALTGKYGESQERISYRALHGIRTMLGQVFSYGVFTNRIRPADNPLPYVPQFRDPERKKPVKKAYTEAEIVTLINKLPKDRIGYAIRLCVACSFRGQELIVLKAEDIAEDGSRIVVDKALKRGEKGSYYIGNTKSRSSDRVIEVPSFAREWVKWLRDNSVGGVVFPGKDGKQITTEKWRYLHKKAVLETGVEPLTPHKLRHTVTTNYRTRMGTDARLVADINGQSDIATMEKYNHVDQDAKRKAADKYDAYMRGLLGEKKESRKPTTYKVLPFGHRLGNSASESRNQAN